MMVGLTSVVICAKLNGDLFGHFLWWEVEFQVFQLTLVVVLTILWHGMMIFLSCHDVRYADKWMDRGADRILITRSRSAIAVANAIKMVGLNAKSII